MESLATEKITIGTYPRVSTDEQKQNSTINNQIMALEEYFKKHPKYKLYKHYSEDGVSGAIPFKNRPAAKMLLEDAKNKKIQMVLVTRTDRLGRSLRVILESIDNFSALEIKFKSISEPYNTETPEGKFFFNSLANFSEFEWNSIRKRSKEGRIRAISEGRWIGGLPPYAYEVNSQTKKLELYKEKLLLGKYTEADVIKKIFDLSTINKYSGEKISILLNNEEIPPYTPGKNKISKNRHRAKLWSGPRVRNLIKEEIYKGEYILAKRSSDKDIQRTIKVPAVVTKEQWDKAQEVLQQNIIKSTRNTKRTYLLSGKIICSKCQRRYTGLLSHTTYYYGCSNYRFKGNDNQTKCRNKNIYAKAIENEIWNDVKAFILKPELITEFIHQKRKELEPVDYRQKLKQVNKNILKLDKKKQKYAQYLGIEDNPIIKNILIELEKIKNDEEQLLEEMRACEDILKQENFEENKLSEIESMLGEMVKLIENPTLEQKKAIIYIMVDKVVVYPSDEETNERRVEISYQFQKGGITKLTLTG